MAGSPGVSPAQLFAWAMQPCPALGGWQRMQLMLLPLGLAGSQHAGSPSKPLMCERVWLRAGLVAAQASKDSPEGRLLNDAAAVHWQPSWSALSWMQNLLLPV